MPHPKARHFASPPQSCTVEVVRTQRDIVVIMCSAVMYDWCVRSDVLGEFVRLDRHLGAVVAPLILTLLSSFSCSLYLLWWEQG